MAAQRRSPVPVGLSNSGVVDNSGQQRREGPEQQSGQELADEGALEEGKKTNTSVGCVFELLHESIEGSAAAAAAVAASHVKGEDGHGHVELVDGVDDDGGGGEEGEYEEEQEVDEHVAADPAEALHRQVFPAGTGEAGVATSRSSKTNKTLRCNMARQYLELLCNGDSCAKKTNFHGVKGGMITIFISVKARNTGHTYMNKTVHSQYHKRFSPH